MKKIKLFKNFVIREYFSHLAFPIGLILISVTIGIEYFFIAVMSGFLVFAVVGISIGAVAFLELKDVPGFDFIMENERRFMTFCSIVFIIIYGGILFISGLWPFN